MAAPAEKMLGVGAAGASSAPTHWYGKVGGDALVNYGPFSLSWAEWIQILGAVYVTYLLVKMTYQGIQVLRGKRK